MLLFKLILCLLLASCQPFRPDSDQDYSYDKGKPCSWYKLSKKIATKVFTFGELSKIDCRIKADIRYVKLDKSSDAPFCKLEACQEILDRIAVSMDSPGQLILDYSKCIQDHRLPIVSVTIAAHDLEDISFLGNEFYSTDTITSKTGKLTLKLKYRGKEFNVVCNVPMIRLENSLFGEGFIISGMSDSLSAELFSGNSYSRFDLRGLKYRVLNCGLYGGSVSYAGQPDSIIYSMVNICLPLLYRGNPSIRSIDDFCESVKPE